MRNLTCKRLQLDEIWSFCYAKEKNVPELERVVVRPGLRLVVLVEEDGPRIVRDEAG